MKLTPMRSRAFLRLQLQVIATEAEFFGPNITFRTRQPETIDLRPAQELNTALQGFDPLDLILRKVCHLTNPS